MDERKINKRRMNAIRVCVGIGRIGYTPANAICDIIDNSVTHGAKNIHVMIKKKNEKCNINKKDNVEEYLIIDDGEGMDPLAVGNALDLGSNDFNYTQDTLSKFGLGLKAASFAQGNRLEVISSAGEALHKEYVDLSEIEDEYFSIEETPTDEDRELSDKYFSEKKTGTIIRITKIHTNNHPSIKSTIEELKEKIGVIYYYFLEKDLHIYVESEEITAIDPLFAEEAGNNNLDENVWDGKSVQWLLRPTEILLDKDARVKGKIEITMLPHPKVWKTEGVSAANIRERYHISASNYGFYVYRNKRLINWANRLDIIPQDQNCYSFRGRINIQSDADDAFNIDVSKSHINLSEDARDALDDYIADYKRKCQAAWKNAYDKYNALISESSNDISNKIMNDVADSLDIVPMDDSDEYNNELERREDEIVEKDREKSVNITIERLLDEGEIKLKQEITDEDINTTVKGGNSVDELNKIFKVNNITDNALWEPYLDAEKKDCVRISTTHRFAKLIYENNSSNKDLQVLFELLMYIQAKAEVNVEKNCHEVKLDQVREIMEEYRIQISEMLAKLCRKQSENLPPLSGD